MPDHYIISVRAQFVTKEYNEVTMTIRHLLVIKERQILQHYI